ncbi:anti-sigma factor [Lipingzhangella sp. LS1_29]|uniref:Regulator of SigK n=1 Tax=Lipingzhangella rawalii TaxID=2055835 RepID=A0ABU2H1T9_9ACTN|nr:anti-sigma factor [Lipingzhangella rawalii]MDS1269261.1 anti-sigma factor [Lipingzhangella rawalii]
MRQDLHTLAGAYALNALSGEDLRRFEDHLSHCDSCRQEVRGLTETTALLGTVAARTPPADLRRRVLEQIATTRQLAPQPAAEPRPRGWWRRWGPGIALAACLVVILALGGIAWDQHRQLENYRTAERQVAEVLAAPDATWTHAAPEEGVSVTMVTAPSQERLVFSAHGLERLDEEDYQLWLTEGDGTAHSAGVLDVAADGLVEPMVAEPLTNMHAVAVTVEPRGGSDEPTTEPMMAMPIEE